MWQLMGLSETQAHEALGAARAGHCPLSHSTGSAMGGFVQHTESNCLSAKTIPTIGVVLIASPSWSKLQPRKPAPHEATAVEGRAGCTACVRESPTVRGPFTKHI